MSSSFTLASPSYDPTPGAIPTTDALPARMRAVRLRAYGGADALAVEDVSVPTPGPTEALVRVRAAGVNPVDAAVRAGYLAELLPRAFPTTLGWDAAGEVVAVGAAVDAVAPGDAVFGMVPLPAEGAYAEYVVIPAEHLARRPASLDVVEAAALPLAGLTAWQALFAHGGLASPTTSPDGGRDGAAARTVLVHAGSGGVGHLAVQLAKAAGHTVLATTSAANVAFVGSLGADAVVDYAAAPFEDGVRAHAPHGVDVVLDLVGGDTQARSYAVLAPGGVLVTTVGQPDAAAAAARGVRAAGMCVQPSAAQLRALAALVDAGRVRPAVSGVLPLADAARAHALVAGGRTRGKLVLRVG